MADQHLVDGADFEDEEQAIAEGLADMDAGRTQPLDEVMGELRAEFFILR